MPHRFHPAALGDLIDSAAQRNGPRIALRYQDVGLSYHDLAAAVAAVSGGFMELGLRRRERVAIYAEKRFETVIALFAATVAGGAFVSINPILRAEQIAHVLFNSAARILVTTAERLSAIRSIIPHCPELRQLVIIDEPTEEMPLPLQTATWEEIANSKPGQPPTVIDQDMAGILYTSGSTGRPKGVVLSHRNLIAGAESVQEYLEITENDRTLCALPLSFDYGLNQVTTAFLAGATAVLMNYVFPRDIIHLAEREAVTGLAAVPPLWIQLAGLSWPEALQQGGLRYITNSGGALPIKIVEQLRKNLPRTKVYLMYGLTEAFRSTYLPPEQLDHRPGSIGRAIPNAEILVVRPDGTPCAPNEPGELVHRGVHVSLGYWGDAKATAERFRPAPGPESSLPLAEIAVWSGDTVKADEQGFLYFVGRYDEMIKTSGYRVSPTEVEEVLYATQLVAEVAAFGVTHPTLGQAIAIVAVPAEGTKLSGEQLRARCAEHLPGFMVPAYIEISATALPRNVNGKIDRKALAAERQDLFEHAS